MKNNNTILTLLMFAWMFMGCGTNQLTEQQRFERSVLKELPFGVDSVSWLTSADLPTFRFANTEYVHASPDAEIGPDGDYWICNMFDVEPPDHLQRHVHLGRAGW